MDFALYMRYQLRSMLVIVAVFAAIGSAFELIDIGRITLTGPTLGAAVGLPLIFFEILMPMEFMRRWPFVASILAKSLLYVSMIVLVILTSMLIYGVAHELTLSDFYEATWSSSTLAKVGVASGGYVVVTFFRQLDRLLGPGTLMRYFFGRYHRPRREERIFMFLDLKDSTAIAERLDVDAYYALLNDFFHDIAGPVLTSRAEIYQYVGDEVVLTWSMDAGLRDSNCIRVFYEIDGVMRRRRSYYLERYGVIPQYKAGVNGGEVIRAEIGDLKRDLIYNGDVLNTTARIQSECNRFNARLLVSSALADRLALPPSVEADRLGEVALRGKRNPIDLIRLDQVDHAGPIPLEPF